MDRRQADRAADAGLIDRWRAGDQRAFSLLHGRYVRRLTTFIAQHIGDADRAEDLVQEVFFRVYRHLDRFDNTRPFDRWIYAIAANMWRNEIRNRRCQPTALRRGIDGRNKVNGDDLEQIEDTSRLADEECVRAETRVMVRRCIGRLSPRHREVLTLRALQERTYDELVHVLGCDLGTVKSRLNRSRRAFAEVAASRVAGMP